MLEVDKALVKRFGEKPLVQPFYDDCVAVVKNIREFKIRRRRANIER